MKIFVAFALVIICQSITAPSFTPTSRCACTQYQSSSTCVFDNACTWNDAGYCTQVQCSDITTLQQCLLLSDICYYSGPSTTGGIECAQFNSCSSMILTTSVKCEQANLGCTTGDATTTTCVRKTLDGAKCSTSTSQSTCTSSTGVDGKCQWVKTGLLTGSCQAITNCSEVTDQTICNDLTGACIYLNGKCQAATCASYTQDQCYFVLSSPLSGSVLTACQWNATTTACSNATSIESLSPQQCSQNTAYQYTWYGSSLTSGACYQCNPPKPQLKNSCECSQLTLEEECNLQLSCLWNAQATTTKCTSTPCVNVTNQQTCSATIGCAWVKSSCVVNTSCSSLQGTSIAQCLYQSVYCGGQSNGNCQSSSFASCITITNATQCNNALAKDGYCTFSNGKCGVISSCNLLTQKHQCDIYSNACIWQYGTTAQCVSRTCSNYLTKETCTFVLPNLSALVYNQCNWNSNINTCETFDNTFTYDSATCFSQSGRTHHWSQPANFNSTSLKGYCIPCQFSTLLTQKATCSCSDIISYTDCANSFPKCYWVGGQCQVQQCSLITSQALCIQINNCYWSGKTEGCQSFGGSGCSILKGNNQQECLAQSIACPSASNGQCSSSYNSCTSISTENPCIGSVGTDGICAWSNNSDSCVGVSECSMITTKNQCNLVYHACYWTESNSCAQQTCSNLSVAECTFYRTSPSQNYQIVSCVANGDTCSDTSGSYTLTTNTCYKNSGGTAIWQETSSDSYSCQTCSSGFILSVIVAFLFIIWI